MLRSEAYNSHASQWGLRVVHDKPNQSTSLPPFGVRPAEGSEDTRHRVYFERARNVCLCATAPSDDMRFCNADSRHHTAEYNRRRRAFS